MRSRRRRVSILLLAVWGVACADAPPTAPSLLEARGGVKGPPGGGGGGGEEPSWIEPWLDFDASTWEKRVRTHATLGHSYFLAENVSAGVEDAQAKDGRVLTLRLPADSNDGGEIRSLARFGGGLFEVRLAAAPVPGTFQTFFLYEGGDDSNGDGYLDEIDIELLPGVNQVWLTVWLRDRISNEVRLSVGDGLPAGFNVTDYHEYGIDYAPGRRVRYFIDGVEVAKMSRRIPDVALFVMANAWWPSWLSDGSGTLPVDHVARYDWIRFTSR